MALRLTIFHLPFPVYPLPPGEPILAEGFKQEHPLPPLCRPMPPTLLAIETATDVCSVALAQAGRVTVELTLTRPRAHAETLAPMIREALRYGAAAARELDAVAVSAGPGSYTGLRIGVSTAKGLALAAEARLLGVPSLEALAATVAPVAAPGDAVCTLFNARRHEVYAAVFLVTEPRGLAVHRQAAALAVDEVPGWLDVAAGRRLWLAGEGVPRVLPLLEAAGGPALRPLGAAACAPSAAHVARLALRRFEAGAFEDLAAFEPFYLKAFVAKMPKASIFERLPF